MTTLYAVCEDVMQLIGCCDSAAVAIDDTDVTVTVVSVTDEGQVTVNITVYDSLYSPSVMCIYNTDDCFAVVPMAVCGVVNKGKKGFPYLLPSVGPGADPSERAVSLQVTISYPPGGRLPLLSARPVVTFPATKHHRLLAGTKLYCLVTEAHRCEQPAQGCYAALPRVGFEPTTC